MNARSVYTIPSNARAQLRTTWFVAVLWNAVSAPMLVVVPRELEGNRLATLGLLFPLIGIGLLAWAIVTTLRWRRFGPTAFTLSLPAVPGGHCSGTIHTRLTPEEARSIRVALKFTCLDRVTTGSGKNRKTSETIVWQEEYTVPEGHIGITASGVSIPVRFTLPVDARETTVVSRSNGILWVLSAEAQMPGVNLKEDFEVPVRRGEEPSAQPEPVVVDGPRHDPVSPTDLAAAGIHIQPTPEGTQYHFESGRNRGFAIGVTVFALIWSGSIWLQYEFGVPWLFIVVTALVDVVILLVVADFWFGSTTVTIGAGVVRRRHTTLGLGATRVIPGRDIKKLELHISMQSSGRSGTPYYELRATLENGRHKHLGDGIANKRHAEWLAARMRGEIGL